MHALKATILLLSLFFAAFLGAQTPYTRHYTVADGLPSNYVYSATQDYRGFIWFSTDNGIARFDGKRFVVFNHQNGLPDNDVPLIFEDHDKRLWVLCWKQAPCYFYNDVLYTTENDTFLKRHFGTRTYFFDVNYRQKRIFFYYLDGENVKWTEYGTCAALSIPNARTNISATTFQFFSHYNRDFILTGAGVYDLKQNKLLSKLPFMEKSIIEEWVEGGNYYQVFADFEDQRMYVCILEKDSFKVVKRLNMAEHDIVYFGRNHLPYFASSSNGNIFTARSIMGEIVPLGLHFPQVKLSNIFQDNYKNLWISTANSGVYFYPPNAARIQDKATDNSVNCLGVFQDIIVGGTLKGNLITLKGDEVKGQTPVVKNGPMSTRVLGIQRIGSRVYVAGDFVLGEYNPGTKQYKEIGRKHRYLSTLKDLELKADGNLLAAGTHGAISYNPRTDEVLKVFSVDRTVAICEDVNGTCWLGTLNGVSCVKEKDSLEKWNSETVLDKARITDIKCDAQNRLWIGTAQSGLFIKTANGIVHINISKEGAVSNSLTSYYVKHIFIDARGMAWVSTDKGLNRVVLRNDNSFQVHKITRALGFPDDNISSCLVKGDTIYLATLSGLTWFTWSKVMISEKPGLEITDFDVNFQKFPLKGSAAELEPDQNNISIGFAAIAFRTSASIVYRYRLLHHDTIWRQTTDSRLNFPQLPDGRYEFQVQAVNTLSGEMSPVRSLRFIIQKPWYREWWFLALLLMAAVALASGFFWSRLRKIHRNSAERIAREKKLADLEMQALRAQMNPHFIFNALTAIQNYFFTHREEEANDYMSRFARLIRQMLEYSRNNFIGMEEELELLNNYMELEKMRFENRLDFRLQVAPDIYPSDYRLPSMVLQPLLENAINHGIRPRKTGGAILLDFSIHQGCLVCTVEDNGPGIDLHMDSLSGTKHKSRGMELLNSRLQAMNLSFDTHIRVATTHVHPDSKDEKGTRIELFFPVELVYGHMKITE